MIYHHFRYFLLIVCLVHVINLTAQSPSDQTKEILQSAIEYKSFTYQVQSMSPTKGGTRQLNPGYSLLLKGDTLVANLPYIGRVHQAAYGADGGFDFTSYTFDYQVKPRKKSGWNVSIKTKDLSSQRQFNLTISENGSASLTVTCSDRESISYYGSLEIQN